MAELGFKPWKFDYGVLAINHYPVLSFCSKPFNFHNNPKRLVRPTLQITKLAKAANRPFLFEIRIWAVSLWPCHPDHA